MVIDTSALIAIVSGEPRAGDCIDAIHEAETIGMSAASFHEASIVIDSRRDPIASRRLDEVRLNAGIHLVPFTAAQSELARQAHRDFGRGSGSDAKLNMGDCYAYALAKELDEPLLFIGNDFIHTDLASALEDPRP